LRIGLAVVLGLGMSARAQTSFPGVGPLLDGVVERLPREPLSITGEILVRKRKGVPVRRLLFDMQLDWGAVPPAARYTIRDAFGQELERLAVSRPAGRPAQFVYGAGDPSVPRPTPPLAAAVQDTDLTWTDLTLAFLWWREGEHLRTETVRGRACDVVAVRPPRPAPTAPGGAHDPADGATPYARVHLWIDQALRMLMQAEAFDADGRRLRRLWVKSIKKIDERWMIKDMEVQGIDPTRRTRLRILDVAGTET
jgi:hypothetical protein